MDGPLGSVEGVEAGELERLRRRAYGRDGDIAGDVAAQARLSELEAAQRRELAPVVDADAGGPAAVSERVPVSEPVEGEFSDHGPAGGSVTGQHPTEEPITDSHPLEGPPAVPWWRRRGLAMLGGAIAALVLIAALPAWISQRFADESSPVPTDTSTALPVPDGGVQAGAPDAVLALVSIGAYADEPRDARGTLDLLGLSAGELRQYEDFNGVKVWSGESRFGMVCLFVVLDDREGSSAQGCSPKGLEATAEIEWFQNEGLTRYVLKGDHVEVYTFFRATAPSQG